MFEKNQYVVCGNNGICQVEDVTTLSMSGANRDRLYYILKPVAMKNSTVYLPVDNTSVRLRRILTREEAMELIDSIPEIPLLRIENEKLREEKYKELMRHYDCKDWICITKTLYLRKKDRLSKKLKTTSTDEKYMGLAENHLFGELALALDISASEVQSFIESRLDQSAEQ